MVANGTPASVGDKCCVYKPLHFWSADTKKWTKSAQPALPSPQDLARGHTCLPVVEGPRHQDGTVDDSKRPDVTVILAEAEEVKKHSSCYAHVVSNLDIPPMWFSESSRKSNGYFGSEILTDDDGTVTGVTTWCRFIVKTFTNNPDKDDKLEYMWDKLNMFTKWESITGKTQIIFFIRPKWDKNLDPSSLFRGVDKKNLQDPFWMYPFALGDIADKQNTSVWAVRSAVRRKEKLAEPSKEQDKEGDPMNPADKTIDKASLDYRSLHDLARHTIHGTETLEAAVAVTESLIQQHDSVKEAIIPLAVTTQDELVKKNRLLSSHRKTQSSLHYHQSIFRTLFHRSTSNKERLLNEINLAFNSVAQSDASASHDLAKASRLDSAAMKTIAFVTTAFLPATFMAAIFSTSFFNFEQGLGWEMSDKFWIYWCAAIPVTVVAVVGLQLWQKRFIKEGETLRNQGLLARLTWSEKSSSKQSSLRELLNKRSVYQVEDGMKPEQK